MVNACMIVCMHASESACLCVYLDLIEQNSNTENKAVNPECVACGDQTGLQDQIRLPPLEADDVEEATVLFSFSFHNLKSILMQHVSCCLCKHSLIS